MLYIKEQSDQKTKKKLFGLNGWYFKKIWYKNISDFKKHKENGTEISKYIGKFKSSNSDYKIDWEIIHHTGKAKNQ